jgi:hypothetical protein
MLFSPPDSGVRPTHFTIIFKSGDRAKMARQLQIQYNGAEKEHIQGQLLEMQRD